MQKLAAYSWNTKCAMIRAVIVRTASLATIYSVNFSAHPMPSMWEHTNKVWNKTLVTQLRHLHAKQTTKTSLSITEYTGALSTKIKSHQTTDSAMFSICFTSFSAIPNITFIKYAISV